MSHGLRPGGFKIVVALAAVAALILTGCGSASSTPKSRLIARADAICKSVNARRKAANRQLGPVVKPSVLPKLAVIAPALASYEHGAVAELRGLTAPSDVASAWGRVLAGAEQIAASTVKLGDYAKTGNLKAVEALVSKDQQSEKEVSSVAATAGFKHCGRSA